MISLSLQNIPVSEPVTPQAVWGGLQGEGGASSFYYASAITVASTHYGKREEVFDWNRGLPSSPSGRKQPAPSLGESKIRELLLQNYF